MATSNENVEGNHMKRVLKKMRLALALALVLVMSFSITASAEGEANQAAQAARDAIFQIEVVYTDPATGNAYVLQSGTGFLIGTEATTGDIMITCDHVVRLEDEYVAWVKDAFGIAQTSQLDTSIRVIVKGTVYVGASILNESAPDDMDFAILKLDQPISERKTLPLKTQNIEETSDVFALGFPGIVTYLEDFSVFTSEDVTITKGSISKKVSLNGYDFIQHSAVTAEGNSGGPLIDANGNVVGVVKGFTEDNSNTYYYALNINEVADVLKVLNVEFIDASEGAPSTTTESTTEPDNPAGETEEVLLRNLVSNANSYAASDYTEESFAALQDALRIANTALNNDAATDDDYKSAREGLETAIGNLEEKVTVDKTGLAAEISSAEGEVAADYDADSFADFELALETAKSVNDKADATQEEVDKALTDLKDARSNLVEKSNTMLIVIIAIIAAVVILIIVLIIVLVSKSKKKAKEEQTLPPYGGMGGGLAAMTPPRPALGYAPEPVAPQPPVAPPVEPARRAPQQNAYPAPPTIPQMGEGAGETVLLNEGSGETTLLSETNQIMAVLVKTKTGEKITIGKREFKIGKERSKVDYCITNNSVSRVHAIITFEDGNYFIKDNNSTNYTYLNGEALPASQKVMLNNNDRIKFSDEEFQFKLG